MVTSENEVIVRVTKRIFESYVSNFYNILYNNWSTRITKWITNIEINVPVSPMPENNSN